MVTTPFGRETSQNQSVDFKRENFFVNTSLDGGLGKYLVCEFRILLKGY